MVGRSSRRRERNQSAYWLSLDSRPHLLHRSSGRLRKGSRATGLPADAVYPLSQKDSNGNDYNGADHKYVFMTKDSSRQ